MRLRVRGDPWLYAFARVLLVAAVQIYGRFSVRGAGHLPAAGPAIVVANHPSGVDPILIGVALPRTLHFLADAVQFRRGFVGPVIERLAAIPVHRGRPDRQALETALRLLAEGEVVVVFAEGELCRRMDPSGFQSGVAFLAARSGAPVIPVAISGAERLWSDGRPHWPWIGVNVGAPLFCERSPRGRVAYARLAARLRDAVVRLHDARPPASPAEPSG